MVNPSMDGRPHLEPIDTTYTGGVDGDSNVREPEDSNGENTDVGFPPLLVIDPSSVRYSIREVKLLYTQTPRSKDIPDFPSIIDEDKDDDLDWDLEPSFGLAAEEVASELEVRGPVQHDEGAVRPSYKTVEAHEIGRKILLSGPILWPALWPIVLVELQQRKLKEKEHLIQVMDNISAVIRGLNPMTENGDISTDIPEMSDNTANVFYTQEAQKQKIPFLDHKDSPFCDRCIQNQNVVQQIMKTYLPDED
ncbi:hypothetical protein HK102_004240, partial [Quaeritorhiza haematococci]